MHLKKSISKKSNKKRGQATFSAWTVNKKEDRPLFLWELFLGDYPFFLAECQIGMPNEYKMGPGPIFLGTASLPNVD